MRWLVVALLGACHHGSPSSAPPPSCEDAAAHVLALLEPKDELATDTRQVFATRCKDDRWPADVRSCITSTVSLKDPKHCKSRLTIAQRSHLDADLQQARQRARERDIPPACRDYSRMLDKLVACDKIPQAARDAMRQGFEAMRTQWTGLDDPRRAKDVVEACKAAGDAMRQAGSSLGCVLE